MQAGPRPYEQPSLGTHSPPCRPSRARSEGSDYCLSDTMRDMELLFRVDYHANGTSHNDIALIILPLGLTLQMDSYHFCQAVDPEPIERQIYQLLGEWMASVMSLTLGESIFLIIDFSDQYFGGFKCTLRENSEVELSYGMIREPYALNFDNVLWDLKEYEFRPLHELRTTLIGLMYSIRVNWERFGQITPSANPRSISE